MKRLTGTFIAAIALDTFGAVAPWSGGPSLPKPSAFVATCLLWFMLGFAATISRGARRAAGQFSVLVLAAMAILGPFGLKLTDTLRALARIFPAQATPAPTAAPAG